MGLCFAVRHTGPPPQEMRTLVKDAVRCTFDESMRAPKIIRLHFARDEVQA